MASCLVEISILVVHTLSFWNGPFTSSTNVILNQPNLRVSSRNNLILSQKNIFERKKYPKVTNLIARGYVSKFLKFEEQSPRSTLTKKVAFWIKLHDYLFIKWPSFVIEPTKKDNRKQGNPLIRDDAICGFFFSETKKKLIWNPFLYPAISFNLFPSFRLLPEILQFHFFLKNSFEAKIVSWFP